MNLFNSKKKPIYCNKIYISVLVFLLLNLIISESINAQNSKYYGAIFLVHFGGTSLKIDDLNTKLKNENYSTLPAEFVTFGVGGNALINKFIIGLEGHNLQSRKVVSEKFGTQMESALGRTYMFMNFGYVVYHKNALLLYPILGVGWARMNLNLKETSKDLDFQSILQNPPKNVDIYNRGLTLNFQVAADFTVLYTKEEGQGGFIFGLHGGYTYAANNWNWGWENKKINESPNINLSGPYLRIMIGLLGYTIHKRPE